MATPYTSVSVQNYNLNAPPDDGSQTPANEITWAGIKSKLADPLKTAIEAVNTNVAAAIAKVDGGITSVNDDYQVLSSDQGKTVVVTVASKTVTTPDATSVGAPFRFSVHNRSNGDITIDGSGAQTVDGAATITLQAGYGVALDTDGSNWLTEGRAPALASSAETAAGTSTSNAVTPAGLATVVNEFSGAIVNGALIASVGSNILTVALKTLAGADPSASDPVVVIFRNGTVTSGQYAAVRVTSALSVAVPAGGTLGFSNSMTGMVHVGFINNAGTVELAISQDGALWTEDRLVSTTAVDTSSDSRTVLYSTSARSNVPCRLGAVIVIQTGSTAGNWSNAPTRVTSVANYPLRPYKNTIKAWAQVNGAGTSIADSFNVSSITDNGAGDLTVTYAVAMANASYSGQVTLQKVAATNGDKISQLDDSAGTTTGAIRVASWDISGSALDDPQQWHVASVGW